MAKSFQWIYFYKFVIICMFGLTNSSNASIFHGFKIPCNDTSPQCLKESLQAIVPVFTRGIPELDVSPLDPFVVNDLTITLPGGVDIIFPQGYTKGLRKCIIDYVRDMGSENYEVQLHCDLMSKNKYRMSGKLLLFQIDGDGDSTIICRNLTISVTFKTVFINKQNGQKYAQIENFKANHSFEGQVSFDITNLFKGNPLLSNLILDFMNQNWRMVAGEFGSPFIDYAMNAILVNLKKVLDAVPADELFVQ